MKKRGQNNDLDGQLLLILVESMTKREEGVTLNAEAYEQHRFREEKLLTVQIAGLRT